MTMAVITQTRNSLTVVPAADHEATSIPASSMSRKRKVVVVHSGARDAYQLGLALSEAGMLEVLITDLFWPSDQRWAKRLFRSLPLQLRSLLQQRSESRLPSARVRLCALTGLTTLLLDKALWVSLSRKRQSMRAADAELGRKAGQHATDTGAALLSYSYYAYDAFQYAAEPKILFQLHPHPASMRRILTDELEANPDCAASLQQEWELALPEEDYQHLVSEPKLASHCIVASSFTKKTLVEHGTPASAISVVPYGVDSSRFFPAPRRPAASDSVLRLLFVGRINQRKGIKYLLEALRLLHSDKVHLTVCGRVVDNLEIFLPFASQVEVRPSVSSDELVRAYQTADLFVFPSVAEGFGQVLLESLACGLPVVSTIRTAAPDLIEDGVQGFIVEPRRSDLIAERIAWALAHRSELTAMGVAARQRAETFTWERFRSGVTRAVQGSLEQHQSETSERLFHV